MTAPVKRERFLVIKLGALGDFIQACGPMQAIRAHHPEARISLLTTPPYAEIGRKCGYFNEILEDRRSRWYDLPGWVSVLESLNTGKFRRVYDLQNNDRTAIYSRLIFPKPEWVGAARGASHRNASPERTAGTSFAGHRQTLALAGITGVSVDDLSWMDSDISRFGLAGTRYALLIAGSSPTRPRKRWAPEKYAALAQRLLEKQCRPVLIGAKAEIEQNAKIAQTDSRILDLTGKTTLFDLAALARGAVLALGNDTGPMHLASVTGCPVCVLFCSKESDPARHAPIGPGVTAITRESLETLTDQDVWNAMEDAGILP